jgi:hypothetical protein
MEWQLYYRADINCKGADGFFSYLRKRFNVTNDVYKAMLYNSRSRLFEHL